MAKSDGQMRIKVGPTELTANTTEEMEELARIAKDIPVKHDVKIGDSRIEVYGGPDQKNGIKLAIGLFLIRAGIYAVKNAKKIKKFIQDVKPKVLSLLGRESTDEEDDDDNCVVDVECEEVIEQEPQEEAAQKPMRKDWIKWFPQEFGSMPELPPILEYVVSRSPKGYEAPMVFHLLCAFAALCFSKVRARYLDGQIHAPNLMVIIEGNWSAGKDKFSTAFHTLFKRIIERDREKCSSFGEGTILQYVGVGATDSWLIDALAYNNGVHMFMFSNEILAIINSMRKNNGLTFYHLRQAFDNGYVSRNNKSGSPQGQFPVFLIISATGTPGDTNKLMAKELEGGSTSRFIFAKIPDVGRYLESLVLPEGEELEGKRDQIDDWNETYCYYHDDTSGRDVPAEEFHIDLGYVNDAIRSWIDDQWLRANGDDSDPRVGARGRMGAIAFHCAMVIHMLFGCPSPDMVQTRRKVIDLTIYLANYCMERFLHKFGDIQKVQREFNNQAEMVEPEIASTQGTGNSSFQAEEEKYSGQFTKSEVIRMKRLYDMMGPSFGYCQVAKAFGLPPSDANKKAIKRAFVKLRNEQQGK